MQRSSEELNKKDPGSKRSGDSRKSLILFLAIFLVAGVILFVFPFEKKINKIDPKDRVKSKKEKDYELFTPSSCTHKCEGKENKNVPKTRRDPHGPYYHKIYTATSKDGLNWKTQKKMVFNHSSVPGAIIRDGVIYVYFVDANYSEFQLSIAISKDLGKTYKKYKTNVYGVDPNPVVTDDGKIKLYCLSRLTRVYSAVSDDGINFTNPKIIMETQHEIKLNDKTLKKRLTDPDVFKTDRDWRMFLSEGAGLRLFVSDDGGDTFSLVKDFFWGHGGVSCTYNFHGTYMIFFGTMKGIEIAKMGKMGMKIEPGAGIKNGEDGPVSSPSVIQLPDGTYMMYYHVDISRKPLKHFPTKRGSMQRF
ncbi:MAG: glycoside hydrolase [Candidatus Eremiobacteraeota bacterium]|nr:glycoside hydrolase [Candidatus Eremiobacteraeota bacterium]